LHSTDGDVALVERLTTLTSTFLADDDRKHRQPNLLACMTHGGQPPILQGIGFDQVFGWPFDSSD
jgi:hypothetical protein